MHSKPATPSFDRVIATFGHVEVPAQRFASFRSFVQPSKFFRHLRYRLFAWLDSFEGLSRTWGWFPGIILQGSLQRRGGQLRHRYQMDVDAWVMHQLLKDLI